MAHDFATAADLLKLNNMNSRDVGASNILNGSPFMAALSAITATQGNKHTATRDSVAPTVGFRAVNTGRDITNSTQEEVTLDLKIMSANGMVDSRLANAYPPSKGGVAGYIARDMRMQLAASLTAIEAALFNGDSGAGFNGLRQALPNLVASGNRTVLGAGGVTADGALTSIYFVRTNDLETDVNLVLGNEGNIDIGETFEQMIADADGKFYPALCTPCEGYLGLMIHSAYSVYRLANISDDNSLTDDLISMLYEQIPEDRQPTFLVMNRKSRSQLHRSRDNTLGVLSKWPEEWNGIPILESRGILNTETQVT